MSTAHDHAAAVLGVPASEISSVGSSTVGLEVTTTDGVAYIVLDEPDAAGHTVLYARPPHPDYADTFPVYSPSEAAPSTVEAAQDPADTDDEPVEADDTSSTDALDGLDRDQLVALAAERGVTIDGRWSAKRIAAALTTAEGANP